MNYVMPCHISDRLYEHTNAWTNAFAVPTDRQLEQTPVLAILVSNIAEVYRDIKNHVYFQEGSAEEGHIGYFNTIPVFIPRIPFKSGAPVRLVTGLNRHGHAMLEKFK